MLADEIIEVMKLDGIEIKDLTETHRSVAEGIDKGNFKFLMNAYGTVIGFLTWEIHDKQIYVNNLFVLRKFAGDSRLYKLRAFFRSEYPTKRLNWHNIKKNKMRVKT